MNWLEADNGFLVNLEKVKAVQRNDDYSSTLYFHLGDQLESVTCNMPFESLKGILYLRGERESSRQDEQVTLLSRISKNQYTAVP